MKAKSTRHTVGFSVSAVTVTFSYPVMISRASLFSSSTTTWERMAPRLCSVFLARRNRALRALRTVGITSSTMRMVVSSRQVASAASPVLVRVVTPRTTLTTPATLSTGVTPPRTRVSISVSLYWAWRAPTPLSSAPPRGTAGSLSAAMAPATAAATAAPASPPRGATSTIRSLLRLCAWVTRLLTVSAVLPRTTAMRSRRLAEAVLTLSRRACWTVRVSLSQTTTAMSSSASSRAKASS